MMGNYIKRLLNLFNHKYDLVDIINRDKENTFFCEKDEIINSVLSGDKIHVLDIGGGGGIEKGYLKYKNNLNITLVEPR